LGFDHQQMICQFELANSTKFQTVFAIVLLDRQINGELRGFFLLLFIKTGFENKSAKVNSSLSAFFEFSVVNKH
jgi:hypothetical protein